MFSTASSELESKVSVSSSFVDTTVAVTPMLAELMLEARPASVLFDEGTSMVFAVPLPT